MKQSLLWIAISLFLVGCGNKEQMESTQSSNQTTVVSESVTTEKAVETTTEITTEESPITTIVEETITTLEESTNFVETEPFPDGVYTSTEILNWSSPVKTAEKGLKQIIKILQDKHEFYDAVEYLFYVENMEDNPEKYRVEVVQNFSDQQVPVGNYEIHGENIETIE